MYDSEKTTYCHTGHLDLIFVGCCGYLGKYFYDSHKAESGFDELKKVVEKTERADATDGYIDKRADNGMLECYYSLYQQNNDVVVDKNSRYTCRLSCGKV